MAERQRGLGPGTSVVIWESLLLITPLMVYRGTKRTRPGCYSPDRVLAGARNEEDRTRARKEN